MPFYLQHPDHGFHVCYTPEDVKAHEAIGWKLKDEAKQEEQRKEEISEPKKRGRKPKVKHGN